MRNRQAACACSLEQLVFVKLFLAVTTSGMLLHGSDYLALMFAVVSQICRKCSTTARYDEEQYLLESRMCINFTVF